MLCPLKQSHSDTYNHCDKGACRWWDEDTNLCCMKYATQSLALLVHEMAIITKMLKEMT